MPDWTFEHDISTAADLTTDLREWLRARPEAPQAQAGALCYEMAALIAFHAPNRTQALLLIDAWRENMRRQVDDFGVGAEHP